MKKPIFRFSTSEAIKSIANEFGKTTEYGLQDWTYIYSEANEIERYLNEYTYTNDEDKKFALMEMILQALVDQSDEEQIMRYWKKTNKILDNDFEIHQFTIHYWMNLNEQNFENCKYLSPLLIKVFTNNESRITTDNNI